MYRAGTFTVTWETQNGEYHISRVFETETEARNFGNSIWKNADVKQVEINRRQFYHKRRRSVVIAQATKGERK